MPLALSRPEYQLWYHNCWFRQPYSGNHTVRVHSGRIVQCRFRIQTTQQTRCKQGNPVDVYQKAFRLCGSVHSGLGDPTHLELPYAFQHKSID